MTTLEKRIATLEQVNGSDHMEPIFIHFVGLGETDKEIQRITDGRQNWVRQPHESEQALKERARLEAQPNPHGILAFVCHSAQS